MSLAEECVISLCGALRSTNPLSLPAGELVGITGKKTRGAVVQIRVSQQDMPKDRSHGHRRGPSSWRPCFDSEFRILHAACKVTRLSASSSLASSAGGGRPPPLGTSELSHSPTVGRSAKMDPSGVPGSQARDDEGEEESGLGGNTLIR
jgi:hypothetical protein